MVIPGSCYSCLLRITRETKMTNMCFKKNGSVKVWAALFPPLPLCLLREDYRMCKNPFKKPSLKSGCLELPWLHSPALCPFPRAHLYSLITSCCPCHGNRMGTGSPCPTHGSQRDTERICTKRFTSETLPDPPKSSSSVTAAGPWDHLEGSRVTAPAEEGWEGLQEQLWAGLEGSW